MKKKTDRKHVSPFPTVQYKHDLGQHFLYDTELLRSLVVKAGLQKGDTVLEIGAGAGTLTRVLCETAARVMAVEVDSALIPNLEQLAREYDTLTIIHRDIRKVDLKTLNLGAQYRIVANIPYSITSQIFDLFWGCEQNVSRMSVMVQKEVADKLIAQPGDKAYGLMSVRCRYYCIPEVVAEIPASAFTPPPKVDSAFVNLEFRKEQLLSPEEEQLFWKLVKAGYLLRRKTLQNALRGVVAIPDSLLLRVLQSMDLPTTVRGEVLSVTQWITLTRELLPNLPPCSPSSRC